MAKSKTEMLADELMRFGRQAKQGATLGFADEIQDVLAAVPAAAFTDMSYSEALKLARELSKDELSNDWQESPWVSGSGQVVGGIPLGLGKFGATAIGKLGLVDDALRATGVSKLGRGIANAGEAATDWIRSGSALSGIGKGAAVGAGYGAAAGTGAADDTFMDRLGGLGLGAALGGVVGGATAPLARMGGNEIDYRKVTEKTAKGFDNKAQQELARQLAARPDLQDQLARAEGMVLSSQNTGIPLTLAEALAQSSSDPLLAQQAVLGSNPMTAGRMQQMYSARSGTPQQAGQIEQQLMRLAQGLDPSVGSYDEAAGAIIGQADKAAKGITRELSGKAGPLYEQAYQMSIPSTSRAVEDVGMDAMGMPVVNSVRNEVISDPFQELVESEPIIKNAIAAAYRDERFSQALQGKDPRSISVIDAAKRIIDEKIRSGANPAAPFDTRQYTIAQNRLLDMADEATRLSPQDPSSSVYNQARSIYSGNPDALQMRERIGALADIDPMNARKVGQQLFSGTQQNADLAAQALGDRAPTAAATRIYGAMDELRNDPVNIASRIAPDQRTSDMLRSYAGSQYQPIEETLNVINQAKLGERMRYGSPTQPRMQAESGLQDAASGALNAAVDVKTGGIAAIARMAARALGRGSEQADPQFYSDMADLMLTPQGMDLVRRVASGQQNAIQELQSVGLPSLLTGGAARATTSLPVARAGIGMMVTPKNESVLRVPQQEDRFSEFDRILQQQYTPQQSQRFDEFDRLLGVR